MAEPLLTADGVCLACARLCALRGGAGFCGVRRLDSHGKLVVDGALTHAAVQPVEQKPLYHFRPGLRLLTVGSWGCGTRCAYCRNAAVALARKPLRRSPQVPNDIVAHARRYADGIAFSFNEPLVRAEQVARACGAARRAGLDAVMVTSGWATKAALDLLLPVTSAWRVDIKAASEGAAARIFGEVNTPWASAFLTLKRLAASETHAEVSLTYSPSIHDEVELARLGAAIVANAGSGTAVHIQPLLPAHRLRDIEVPTLEALLSARGVLQRAGLTHVYVHLLGPAELRTTWCSCGAALVERRLGRVTSNVAPDASCLRCGAATPIHWGTPTVVAA